MNERINELIENSTIRSQYYPAGCNGYPECASYFDQQKFAQLIVRECMDLVSQCSGKVHPDDLNAMFAEHFGIDT